MEFLEAYKGDIKAFIDALVEFFKTIIGKLMEGNESAAE